MAPNLSKGTGADPAVMEFGAGRPSCPPTSFGLQGGKLCVNGHLFLSDVPSNIVVTPTSPTKGSGAGCFLGFDSDAPKSWHVAPVGKLSGIRFMSIFRFKVWWTTHWTGNKGRDVEHETQTLMLEKSEDSGRPYVLLLPVIEGGFRASLRPGEVDDEDDHVAVCVESGSTRVTAASFRAAVYMHAGDDPYKLVRDAMKAVRTHLGTFKLLEEKTPPGIVDKFGWCTWDAFYLTVYPEGVWEGVKNLADGGCPPGMVLIDDGWQSICHDEDDPLSGQEGMNRTSAGEQMPCRLIKFQENYKFRDYRSHEKKSGAGLGAFVRDLKETFESVEQVYVWHALCGYWGGVRPGVPGMPEARVIPPKLTPGLETTMEDLAVDKIVNNGVGLVPPATVHQMYEGLHSHLAASGIDGVKVDVIHLLELVCEEYGGRVELAKAYYKALSDSVKKHFKGNGVIASMEHCNDFMLLGTETVALGRVGDDFWCTDPSGDPNGTFWLQGFHMVHCAYNSMWMGNVIHPDWDMFQTTHPCAKFHAASRAISGGPIYVSDSVGNHDFDLLKSLALPDGTILRCQHYALPTRDCLFEDPLHNGKTMLKIWNLNKITGTLGAFNCQGGGWDREERRNKSASEYSHIITSTAKPNDIEWENGKVPFNVQGLETFAVYFYQAKKLMLLKCEEDVEITLAPFDFELLTVSPVKTYSKKSIQFAPIGLVNMLNTGGAIQSLEFDQVENVSRVGVKGRGELRVFSSVKPTSCRIDGADVEFVYDQSMVAIQVPWSQSSGFSIVEYFF